MYRWKESSQNLSYGISSRRTSLLFKTT